MSALLVSPSPGVECSTPVLDNPGQNDFNTCDENTFSGPVLGECEDWSLGARVEQKGNKGVRVSCCEGDEERAQVGSGGNKS